MKTKALLYLVPFVLVGQTSAYAVQVNPPLTSTEIQRFSRDLVPFNSQDFFNKGQDLIEREIQILRQRQSSPNEPVLKVNPQPQVEEKLTPRKNSPDPSSPKE
ncbi:MULTISPECIES: hypothetical protein [Nostocales]|uniref:Low temperature-induced protein n=3 Tax=Nostocales TaxID=1161 RepID=A0A0C1NDY5_9CYAN|nr:hypothetical protein [Tolypothrix bouteillei]KAF3888067.1 hypothetical protein DA73_0400023170 [Tolypothrix bouteillei VB521301]